MASSSSDPRELLSKEASWLFAPELGTCVVGSAALAEACRRRDIAPPRVGDLDLSWGLDLEKGQRLLEEHSTFLATTEQNRARGTLAAKLGGQRIEITSYRGASTGNGLGERLLEDLALRDMTVGAVAWRLFDDAILDPMHGVEHWHERRVVACGDPRQRIAEHPIRHVRYYRRAHEWGFAIDPQIRKVAPDHEALASIPREALAQELRLALVRCASPGRFLLELHEARALGLLVPELDPQFDGRPAGPSRHHPEISQALHVVLALEWLAQQSAGLLEEDRLAVAVAVLCHDLGKNSSTSEEWPSHHGHDDSGRPLVARLLDTLPGLTTSWSRRLAEAVCALHLTVRDFERLRPGTRVDLYEQWFKAKEFRVDLFALAIAADVAGRLGHAIAGERVASTVAADIHWLRERCGGVDAAAIKERIGNDIEKFKAALHEARARAVTSRPRA